MGSASEIVFGSRYDPWSSGGVGVAEAVASGKFEVVLPAFKGFKAEEAEYLWPSLFILVACGAISGFHSLVASGTTAKQIRKETDAKIVGYGSMLLEGVLAVIAIGTVMISGKPSLFRSAIRGAVSSKTMSSGASMR